MSPSCKVPRVARTRVAASERARTLPLVALVAIALVPGIGFAQDAGWEDVSAPAPASQPATTPSPAAAAPTETPVTTSRPAAPPSGTATEQSADAPGSTVTDTTRPGPSGGTIYDPEPIPTEEPIRFRYWSAEVPDLNVRYLILLAASMLGYVLPLLVFMPMLKSKWRPASAAGLCLVLTGLLGGVAAYLLLTRLSAADFMNGLPSPWYRDWRSLLVPLGVIVLFCLIALGIRLFAHRAQPPRIASAE